MDIFKCKKCGTEESKKDTPTIMKVKTPRALLPHSFASSTLATDVIYQKYYMGVPLYRQEKVWDDRGLVRDFIPVLDSNNKPALYDKVEEKFYYNKGNGEDFKYKL